MSAGSGLQHKEYNVGEVDMIFIDMDSTQIAKHQSTLSVQIFPKAKERINFKRLFPMRKAGPLLDQSKFKTKLRIV